MTTWLLLINKVRSLSFHWFIILLFVRRQGTCNFGFFLQYCCFVTVGEILQENKFSWWYTSKSLIMTEKKIMCKCSHHHLFRNWKQKLDVDQFLSTCTSLLFTHSHKLLFDGVGICKKMSDEWEMIYILQVFTVTNQSTGYHWIISP